MHKLRKHTFHRHRQPYGSHHERVQYGMCERVATTADPHFRNARILNGMAVSAPPILKTLKTKDMIAKTILQQIGGKRFTAMTGSRDFIDMGNGLRMSLARNKTSANRLDIIYDEGADLYNMRFYRRTFSKKTFECKTKDIAVHEGIYFDMLEEMFTMVTGLYTRF